MNKFNVWAFFFLIFFSFLLLFSGLSLALCQMRYYVLGYDNTTLGRESYGTNGYNYVMKSPTVYDQHVSSLYVYN